MAEKHYQQTAACFRKAVKLMRRIKLVIDGQGIALWDCLIAFEFRVGQLQYRSDIWLDDRGYFILAKQGSLAKKGVGVFLK